jgi:hypothetical protein
VLCDVYILSTAFDSSFFLLHHSKH